MTLFVVKYQNGEKDKEVHLIHDVDDVVNHSFECSQVNDSW